MIEKNSLAVVLVATFALHYQAEAATFTAFTSTSSCTDFRGGAQGAEASCPDQGTGEQRPDAFASASPGLLKVGAQSAASRNENSTLVLNTGRSQARVDYEDRLNFSIDDGFIALSYDLLGLTTLSVVGFAPGRSSTVGTFVTFESGDQKQSAVFEGRRSVETGNFFTRRDVNEPIDDISGVVEFAFSGGVFDLRTILAVEAECGSIKEGGRCSAIGMFENSLRFVGATVFDTSGNKVQATIDASSGFDYANGLDPHDRSGLAPVPLPAGALLLTASIASFAVTRRRRCKGAYPPGARSR